MELYMAEVTRLCVLRSGGDYRPEHVQWLAKQVPGLTCLSDVPIEGVPTIPLPYDWPGWWAKMCLFSPSLIDGDIFYIDLDTVVLGGVEELEEAAQGKTTMLSDFYWPDKAASGMMYIAEPDKFKVWTEWMRCPDEHMARKPTRGAIGDQAVIGACLPDVQRWQDVAPGAIVSYKVHCKPGVPDGAKIVCFHGKPRPFGLDEEWVPSYDG